MTSRTTLLTGHGSETSKGTGVQPGINIEDNVSQVARNRETATEWLCEKKTKLLVISPVQTLIFVVYHFDVFS